MTSKTNRPSLCVILKITRALDGLFSVLFRLDFRKHEWTFCWMKTSLKHHWTLLLSDIVAWDSFSHGTRYFFSDIDTGDSYFPGFGKYIFHQLHACTALVLSADCTEGCCSSNIVIVNNYLVFNFTFFNFEQEFPFPLILFAFSQCCTPLSIKCL